MLSKLRTDPMPLPRGSAARHPRQSRATPATPRRSLRCAAGDYSWTQGTSAPPPRAPQCRRRANQHP
eukprot:1813991-Pyramimonas_sp.AAC.1